MTPSARLQAVADLLTEIEATPRPADALVSAFFRSRRYIGAHDRNAIAEAVYAILRRYARLGWWLDRSNHPPTPRALVIADQLLARGQRAAALDGLFSGGKYAPEPLEAAESRLATMLDRHTLDHPEMPEAVRLECPTWAEAGLRRALGSRFAAELSALLENAPLDLRVNAIKTDRARAIAALREAGLTCEATRWSPFGIRVEGRPPLAALAPFKAGWVEIQDEGSQLVALIADARPGHQVVDFCAGAGGKTLALAAAMANKGRVVACDVLGRRLERAAERLRRAGLHNVETRALSSARDPWVKRHKGKFDRVLVDAPCTGTGTWRRNPDSRWRPLGPGLSELVPLQAAILDSAARLVRPGGRLIYATCSLVDDENRGQIDCFLASHPDFVLRSAAELWATAVGGELPFTGPCLALSPARHGTDAFFAAVLERAPVTAVASADAGKIAGAPDQGEPGPD
ncbi:MAG: methyltransferase domain-containing protein [Azospirillum sp.]|nr:methyltransferase domain-containing protein [Azospirillum sp.]